MLPDPTFLRAGRTPRRPARFIAALCLVAVTAACSTDGDHVTPVASTAAPSAATTSPDVNELPHQPTAKQGGGLEGPYVLRIPRIGVDTHIVPIKSNDEGILEPPPNPTVVGWWSDGAAPRRSERIGGTGRTRRTQQTRRRLRRPRGFEPRRCHQGRRIALHIDLPCAVQRHAAERRPRSQCRTDLRPNWSRAAGRHHLRRLSGYGVAVQHRDHRGARLTVIWA